MNQNPSPLPQLTGNNAASVPVYCCHVVLGIADAQGRRTGRVANLSGIQTAGTSEREILLSLTRQFKAIIQRHHADGTEIPWVEAPVAAPGETERFIPVHL